MKELESLTSFNEEYLSSYILEEVKTLDQSGIQPQGISSLLKSSYNDPYVQLLLEDENLSLLVGEDIRISQYGEDELFDSIHEDILFTDLDASKTLEIRMGKKKRFKKILKKIRDLICKIYNSLKDVISELPFKDQLKEVIKKVIENIENIYANLAGWMKLIIRILLWVVRSKWLKKCISM